MTDIERGLELAGLSESDIETIVHHYLVAQLWAQIDMDSGDDCECLDAKYSIDDVDTDYVEALTDELRTVLGSHPLAWRLYKNRSGHYLEDALGQWGHDFYLTREGHGAGFWDRGHEELGEYWTKIAKSYGGATHLWADVDGTLKGE